MRVDRVRSRAAPRVGAIAPEDDARDDGLQLLARGEIDVVAGAEQQVIGFRDARIRRNEETLAVDANITEAASEAQVKVRKFQCAVELVLRRRHLELEIEFGQAPPLGVRKLGEMIEKARKVGPIENLRQRERRLASYELDAPRAALERGDRPIET